MRKSALLSPLKFKANLTIAAAMNVLHSGCRILFAYMMMSMTDNLIAGSLDLFVRNILIASGVVVLQMISMQLSARSVNKYVNTYMIWIRKQLMRGIVRMPINKITPEEIESQRTLMDNEMLYFEDGFIRSRVDIFSSLILLAVSCAAIANININFLIILFAVVAVSSIFPSFMAGSMKRANQRFLKINEQMISTTNEFVEGNKSIQINNARALVDKLYSRKVYDGHRSKESFQNFMTFSNSILVFVSLLVTFVLFLVGGFMVSRNIITVGALIAVVQISSNIMQPITEILYSVNELNASGVIKEKILGYVEYSEKVSLHNEKAPAIGSAISFDNVSYAYDEKSMDAVKEVSLSMEQSKSYAIVGGNGSGKSTLLKLLTGELKNYSGHISINGLDICHLSTEEYFKHVGYVEQNPFLFNTGWEDNISLFGLEDMSEGEIMKVVLPDHDSHFSPSKNVNEMSGGERQRVLLGRALNTKKPILILDEFESAMDVESKRQITQTISRMDYCTRLVVTHNISEELRLFDEVIHMEDGMISERGHLDELLKRNGPFTRAYGDILFSTSKES